MKFSALTAAALLSGYAAAKVNFAGVNIAGCDFGCDITGTCNGADCPNTGSNTGLSQLKHFSNKDKMNIFRLPVGWQYLVNHNLGGKLDDNFMKTYDELVNACLATGARCIVDVHNYARWNGKIIGQSGGAVTDDQYVSLWKQLSARYQKHDKVVFGLMNEPHSTPGTNDFNMNTWANTLQKVVDVIRKGGATDQWILLSGTNFDALGGFAENSAPALSKIKNPDGTHKNLIYEAHIYYDSDSSGTHTECVSNHLDAYTDLYNQLNKSGRQVLVTETGGGNTQSCVNYVCDALDYMNSHSDLFLGWVGWAAGSFAHSYELDETPKSDGSDQLLVQKCIAGKFN